MRSATSILVIAMAISFAAEGKESPPELVSALVREEADASSGRKVVVQVSDDPTNHRFPLLVFDKLTAREVEVLRLLAAGRTNRQIADELVIAISTVTSHVANIFGKTGSANRIGAAAYAAQKGLVEA